MWFYSYAIESNNVKNNNEIKKLEEDKETNIQNNYHDINEMYKEYELNINDSNKLYEELNKPNITENIKMNDMYKTKYINEDLKKENNTNNNYIPQKDITHTIKNESNKINRNHFNLNEIIIPEVKLKNESNKINRNHFNLNEIIIPEVKLKNESNKINNHYYNNVSKLSQPDYDSTLKIKTEINKDNYNKLFKPLFMNTEIKNRPIPINQNTQIKSVNEKIISNSINLDEKPLFNNTNDTNKKNNNANINDDKVLNELNKKSMDELYETLFCNTQLKNKTLEYELRKNMVKTYVTNYINALPIIIKLKLLIMNELLNRCDEQIINSQKIMDDVDKTTLTIIKTLLNPKTYKDKCILTKHINDNDNVTSIKKNMNNTVTENKHIEQMRDFSFISLFFTMVIIFTIVICYFNLSSNIVDYGDKCVENVYI